MQSTEKFHLQTIPTMFSLVSPGFIRFHFYSSSGILKKAIPGKRDRGGMADWAGLLDPNQRIAPARPEITWRENGSSVSSGR